MINFVYESMWRRRYVIEHHTSYSLQVLGCFTVHLPSPRRLKVTLARRRQHFFGMAGCVDLQNPRLPPERCSTPSCQSHQDKQEEAEGACATNAHPWVGLPCCHEHKVDTRRVRRSRGPTRGSRSREVTTRHRRCSRSEQITLRIIVAGNVKADKHTILREYDNTTKHEPCSYCLSGNKESSRRDQTFKPDSHSGPVALSHVRRVTAPHPLAPGGAGLIEGLRNDRSIVEPHGTCGNLRRCLPDPPPLLRLPVAPVSLVRHRVDGVQMSNSH